MNKESNCEPCESTLIAGDLNLLKTDWSKMLSFDDYGSEIIDFSSESNFTNFITQKLDAVLTDNPEPIIESTTVEDLNRKQSFNGKQLSDRLSIKTIIQTNMTFIIEQKKHNMPTRKQTEEI